MCTHTCAYYVCARQNVSKVGYAQINFKRAFWRKTCVWYCFYTQACLKKEKTKVVNSGVHKLKNAYNWWWPCKSSLVPFHFLHHLTGFPQDFHRVALCYSCNIQINFQRRFDSVMGCTIILIAVISKGFTNVYFHNMFSFCCTDNLTLGALFWIARTWLSEYLMLHSTSSAESTAFTDFHFSSGGSVPLLFRPISTIRLYSKRGL